MLFAISAFATPATVSASAPLAVTADEDSAATAFCSPLLLLVLLLALQLLLPSPSTSASASSSASCFQAAARELISSHLLSCMATEWMLSAPMRCRCTSMLVRHAA